MDATNMFETPNTFRAVRAEYLVALVALSVILVMNIEDVRWWAALILFWYPDVLGYWPGAIAFRRAKGGPIAKHYYLAYNIGHSLVTAAVVAGLWALIIGPEMALLIIPWHFCIDRGIFGNGMKPFSVPFEPHPHPVFAAVKGLLQRPAHEFGDQDQLELDLTAAQTNGKAEQVPAAGAR